MAFIADIKTSSFLVLICFLTCTLHTTTQACHLTDRAALLDFKSKISEDPSGLLGTWNQSTDCCTQWEGIACDRHGRVSSIARPGAFSTEDFSWVDTYMSGTLSPSLGKLKFLRYLDLSNLKNLEGTIPMELGSLSHLTTLYLYSNNLKGSIPVSFQNLRNLKMLFLSENRLSGKVPINIFQHMSSLSELVIYDNKLSGSIPSSIGKLVSLKRLDFHLNNFSGSIPSTIGSLKNLVTLELTDNQISGSIPTSIGELSKLKELYLSQNSLGGSIPSSISKLVSLERCFLQDNKLTGSIPASIGNTALRYLVLDNNMLTGKLPISLGNLTNLVNLNAKNNHLTGKIPSSFSNLLSLQYLDISRNGLSGPIPSKLVKLNPTLKILDLSYNPLSLVNVPSWMSKMNLQGLHLAQTGLVGELPEWLSSTSFGYLDLSSNMLTGALPAWIGNMTSLESLNISNNGFHSDIPIEFKSLSGLRQLDFHSNNFTGGLNSIFPKDGNLFHYGFIDLSYNMFVGRIDNIGDLGGMDLLNTLDLSNNHLSGSIPKSLAKLNRSLNNLKLEKNRFTGSIPSGVINLLSLVEFDVSYNKLTGKIPPHTTPFPASSFQGNSALCDSPLLPCKTA
ncbi:hypothetical protein MKW94_010638 [Papaver nudicaule]|uniref:Leucine-rich repeat-containing N-terminal plant-type domain-containing protein n=1 Tax=Papaver nudicaule TaxID=74823 RepID=A0AA42AZU4_PAPNU|nr:hypothetical protein [Papaver nudicaule]